MKPDKEIETLGFRWFCGAGAVALALAFFLVTVDHKLSTSKKEEVLSNVLNELRVAQATLPSAAPDPRELRGLAGFASHKAESDKSKAETVEHDAH